MGSSTIIENITTMAEDKKNPLKCLLKNIKCKLGIKKEKEQDKENKKETKHKDKEITDKDIKTEIKHKDVKVEDILDNFRKLEIEKKKESEKKVEEDELKNFSFKTVANDEHKGFTYKVVEEDRSRTDSVQSQDSGFSEKDCDEISKEDDDVIKTEEYTEVEKELEAVEDSQSKKAEDLTKKEEEVLDSLQNLKIDDGKKKKAQIVPVARGPVRNRVGDISGSYHPYGVDTQINTTINRHTFSGGQVIVAQRTEPFSEIPYSNDQQDDLQTFNEDLESIGVQLNGHYNLDEIQEYLDENDPNGILGDFFPNLDDQLNSIPDVVDKPIAGPVDNNIVGLVNEQNPIEELETANILNFEDVRHLDFEIGFPDENPYTNMFPTPPSTEPVYSPSNAELYSTILTPPRSETNPSPFYATGSDVLSPTNSELEEYQIIPPYEEFPNIPEDVPNVTEDGDKKARQRCQSQSSVDSPSLSMKNFKDLQKELAATFSIKECCQINRKPCRELFQVHMKKLKAEERKSMCLKISSMDLKTVYGTLHHILIGLARGDVDEDLHMSLFALLCEKVLGTKPQLFTEDYGLSLLKAASLRCPQRPLLVRYLVQCVRAAIKHNPALAEGKDYMFKEVDALGDTLVTACARGGDVYADVLSELVRREHNEKPLFNVQHTNTEGCSALHVACRDHSAASKRLQTVHVLLEHGGADIWKGDVKGGDTAVHLAVNSAACDLHLVLLLFKHLDRKEWKKLAHCHNRSSVTPLDYARCAAKSTTRTNYPSEVLEFLKKCR